MEIMSMVKRLKTTSSSSSSSTYDDDDDNDNVAVVVLHEDLICEILFHLPPTHVLRLKSVSKGWFSIISNPSFLRTHSLLKSPHLRPPYNNNNNNNNQFLIFSDTRNGNHVHLRKNKQIKVLLLNLVDLSVFPITACASGLLPAVGFCRKLVDSCNGLLLYLEKKYHEHPKSLVCDRIIFMDDLDVTCFYMCNPFTKQHVKLPSIKPTLISSHCSQEEEEEEEEEKRNIHTVEYCDTRIVFDPYVSSSYKVISVIRFTFIGGGTIEENPKSTNIPIYVYSSQTGSWRFSTSIPLKYSCFGPTRGVYLDGVMYWTTETYNLACFDVEKNTTWFQPMPPTKSPYSRLHISYFGVCGGRLRLVQTDHAMFLSTGRDGFDIMEMTTEDGKWTKKYHVNLEGFIKMPLTSYLHLDSDIPWEGHKTVIILHIYKTASGKNKFKEADDDEDEEAVLMEIHRNYIVSFSVKSNSFERKLLKIKSNRYYRDVCTFSNITLFPL